MLRFVRGIVMLRHSFAVAVLLVVSAGAARAQVTGAIPGTGGFDDQQFYWNTLPSTVRRETAEDREIERRYNETLRTRIPDRKPASSDPWRTVRSAPKVPVYDRHRPE
jgi:hypothetical protein